MEPLAEQTQASGSELPTTSDASIRTVSKENIGAPEQEQTEEEMTEEDTAAVDKVVEAMLRDDDNAQEESNTNQAEDGSVTTVTPLSAESDGIQPPDAPTLEESLASNNVESPKVETPSNNNSGRETLDVDPNESTNNEQTNSESAVSNDNDANMESAKDTSSPDELPPVDFSITNEPDMMETTNNKDTRGRESQAAVTADERRTSMDTADDGSQSGSSQLVDTDNEIMENESQNEDDDDVHVETAVAVPAAASTEVIDLLDSDDEEEVGPPAAKRSRTEQATPAVATQAQQEVAMQQMNHEQRQFALLSVPRYQEQLAGFTPSWKHLVPASVAASAAPQVQQQAQRAQTWKYYELSLLNVSEFTISGLRVGDEYSGYMTSVSGLRSQIKKISKGHGNAYFERDPEGGTGKWHIPLGAYHAFYGYLRSLPNHRVDGISEAQLKIASLGKARLEKDYPSARKLAKLGVPKQLANALAPFQRGGVDFTIDKGGRSLIADEMGLGKTIQGIASMSVYHDEWPLLVLCPSSARYHWENEFRHWLGKSSTINNDDEKAGAFDGAPKEDEAEEEEDGLEERPPMPLLEDSQIHVLTSGHDAIFPLESTKVVICSYGLAPNLVTNEKLVPGMFKCAIVDESHMLKNKSTQRTKKLLPLLQATTRCVLLSGTPAFARPLELWPQLQILGTEQHGWGADEKEYIRKYSRGGSARRAELHTMLLGTVMIRRMKNDILKTLPQKEREQGVVDVMDAQTRREMKDCMVALREGKGKLCELARLHEDDAADQSADPQDASGDLSGVDRNNAEAQLVAAGERLRQEIEQRRNQGIVDIERHVMTLQHDPATAHQFRNQLRSRLDEQLHSYYRDQMRAIEAAAASGAPLPPGFGMSPQAEPPSAKKAVLNYMYSLTGKCKVPIVVEMLKKWLADPSRGKLCIFAHHIWCLDEITKGAGLSNATDSTTKFIRIDGSTSPKARQEQINRFQRDPSVRVAILGITAAGVAVTLTASSTVWFAELFWTPAIMIQAEDRAHRIGQQATVKCLYFVAKGTLDELLWKLLENKFQDLGEFVEGKEKLKMVVNKTYHSTHELLKTLTLVEDDLSDGDSACSLEEVEELGSDIEHEIEELALSEQKLLDADADNEGSDPDSQTESDSKPAAKAAKKDTIGTTEDQAICLSDDEDEVAVVSAARKPEESTTESAQEAVATKPPAFNINTASFPQTRVYKLWFTGSSYGVYLAQLDGRVAVQGRTPQREQMFGPDVKPHVGDILVALNGYQIPVGDNLKYVTKAMQDQLARGAVELTFAEDEQIRQHAKDTFARRAREREAQHQQLLAQQQNAAVAQQVVDSALNGETNAAAASQDSGGVIEID